jgi:hypothetical protein
MDGKKLIDIYYIVREEVPESIIFEYLESRLGKLSAVLEQNYEEAAKWRGIERDCLKEYNILVKFEEVINATLSLESTEKEVRNIKINILLD